MFFYWKVFKNPSIQSLKLV